MGWYPPPQKAPNRAKRVLLPRETILYRVHSELFGPTEFNPTDPASREAGEDGRFDSLGGDPAYLYAARSQRVALAESLLRDVPFDEDGIRQVPLGALRGRCISSLRTTDTLSLVALHGEGLARLGQDGWLVTSDASQYPLTCEWGKAILGWVPSAHGLQWRPRHDDDGLALCLYEDRAAGRIEAVSTLPLWSGDGLALVRTTLSEFGVVPPDAVRSR